VEVGDRQAVARDGGAIDVDAQHRGAATGSTRTSAAPGTSDERGGDGVGGRLQHREVVAEHLHRRGRRGRRPSAR
jgi:hypothetical protein